MRTKLDIDYAYSMDNGICFYSKRHKNYVAIATIDEQGIISTEWTTMKKYKSKSKQDKKFEMRKIVVFLLFTFLFTYNIFRLANWLASINKFYLYIRTFLLGWPLILLGLFIIYTQNENKTKKNLHKYHSAEHMILNAYSNLKRVPTLKEIYQYSQFRNDCGTNILTAIIISFILTGICTFIPSPLYQLIVMLLVNIIVYILLKFGCLNFLQQLNTTTPTDTELLVAIYGMNAWLENEKKREGKI